MPEIIPLKDWYPAMAAKVSLSKVPWGDRTHYVHHHTVGGAGKDPLTYARQVADMHYTRWRVPGGYGVLVGTDGVLRAMCGLDGLGVHAGTREWNRRGIGLAYQGDFRLAPPSGRMLTAAAQLIAAHPLDQTTHRAVRPDPTSCPGDALIRLLPLEVDMPISDEDAQKVALAVANLKIRRSSGETSWIQETADIKSLLLAGGSSDVSDADLDAAVQRLIEVIPDRTRAVLKAAL